MTPMPVLPGMRAPMANVAIVFDTSGSMSGSEMTVIQQEAVGIMRALPGVALNVIACDAQVHGGVQKLNDVRRAKLAGGGGTSFIPAFREARLIRPKIDLLVFGTDGYGDYPSEAPPFRTIWLQTPGGRVSAGFGKVIDLG